MAGESGKSCKRVVYHYYKRSSAKRKFPRNHIYHPDIV